MIKTMARLLVSLLGALGVLCAGAWAGGAFAPSARAGTGRMPRATDDQAYPRASEAGEIAVGDALVVNGQPMQLSLFYTSDAPARVAGFYAEAFVKRGLLPIAAADGQVAHVSVFDPQDGLQRFINAVPQPDGQTLVMVGVTNPRHPARLLRGGEHAPFPVPIEHRAFLGYESNDAGAQAKSGQFVSSLSAGAVIAYYRQQLGAQGWLEKSGEASDGMTIFGRGSSTFSVAVQALGDKEGCAVFVNQLEGGAR